MFVGLAWKVPIQHNSDVCQKVIYAFENPMANEWTNYSQIPFRNRKQHKSEHFQNSLIMCKLKLRSFYQLLGGGGGRGVADFVQSHNVSSNTPISGYNPNKPRI